MRSLPPYRYTRSNLSMRRFIVCCVFVCCAVSAQSKLSEDIKQLSDPAMQGRKTGSAGAEMARLYLAERFTSLNLTMLNDDYRQVFNYGFRQRKEAINMIGLLRGCRYSEHYIVVTAHYDHLGRQGRKVFQGADDNASGVAAMLELAARLAENCPAYSYLLVATDAEESGLYGSKALVSSPPVPISNVVLNLNLDMIGHPDQYGKLYLTGARGYPGLITILQSRFSQLKFLHHRGPRRNLRENRHYDWPDASDHGPFYRAGIPYLFFGGQDHRYYHTPDDTWQRINPEFIQMAMQTIWQTVEWLEQQPPAVLRPDTTSQN